VNGDVEAGRFSIAPSHGTVIREYDPRDVRCCHILDVLDIGSYDPRTVLRLGFRVVLDCSHSFPSFTVARLTMASTEDLHISNLFSLKDHVCLVTGGGEYDSKSKRPRS
jgi:hypothetical protein